MADTILLERRGVLSAAICTEALRASADAMAAIQGAPGYRYAVVPHPVSSLDAAGLRAHAALAGPQILEILRGGEADAQTDAPVDAPADAHADAPADAAAGGTT